MENIVKTIETGGVVPVVRLPDLSQIVAITAALLAGGVTAVELTMSSPGAVAALARLKDQIPAFTKGKAVLGMGSVLDRMMAETAVSAGAQFIVAPHTDIPMMTYCQQQNIPIMPGALTPTEIQTAWANGAAIVKVFPARLGGPSYLKDMLAPLPHLKLLPTGGINLGNAAAFIHSGAVAVGVGSSLLDRQIIAAQKWVELSARTAAFVQTVQEARNSK